MWRDRDMAIENKKNIFQKMSAITQEISTVAKNLQVGEGKSQYKAVGEADVLAAVKPVEARHGVYSYPYSREIVESGEMVATTKYGERKSLYLRLKTVYRFVNMENPDEYIDITTYGDGVDTQDKATGKAMTYSDKYALLKAYKIQTGDDPDQNASETLNSVNRRDHAIDRTGPPAYPAKAEMLGVIAKAYPEGKVREALLMAMHAKTLEEMSDAAIKSVYNKCMEKKK